MVRTKKSLQNKESVQGYGDSLYVETSAIKIMEDWDLPSLNGKRLKSTMVKTYSKRRPRKLTSITKPDFGPSTPNSPPKTAETENFLAPDPEHKSIQKTPGNKTYQAGSSAEHSTKKQFFMVSGSSCRKTNKTTVCVGSMIGGTMVGENGELGTSAPMSLCTMVGGIEPDHNNIHNSTVDMANDNGNVRSITEYVPGDISVIKGDEELKVYSSFCNELTPPEPKTGLKVPKRVMFSVGRTEKVAVTNQTPKARRSILKTPRKRLSVNTPKCLPQQKTSAGSCGHRKKSTTLQFDNAVYNSNQSKGTTTSSGSSVASNTEKLLQFDPLPLQCSDNNLTGSSLTHRDVTPEMPNSAAQLSVSGKESRRLLYPPHGKDPVCFLLDFPLTKPNNAIILHGADPHQLTLEEINLLMTDILQRE